MMPDREKVINGLESCVISKTKCFFNKNEMCPYASVDVLHCEQELMRDALDLLKEQEDLGTELTNAVELIHKKNERIKKLEKLLKEQENELIGIKAENSRIFSENIRLNKLLKEQEAVKPYIDIDEAKCPNCKVKLTRQELLGEDVLFEDFFDYCPHCGRKVKWQ